MARPTVDGPGQAKLQTLDDAMAIAQSLHGIVERMAIAVRGQQPTAGFAQQIKRTGTPLVGMLRSQFMLIADLSADLMLVATRGGGGDQAKLRALRERVAHLKTALELAQTQVLTKHALEDKKPAADPADG
jgi:hypothetical protein